MSGADRAFPTIADDDVELTAISVEFDAYCAAERDAANLPEASDDDDTLRAPSTCSDALLHWLVESGNAWKRAARALTTVEGPDSDVVLNRYGASASAYEEAAARALTLDDLTDEDRQAFIADALDAAAWMRAAIVSAMQLAA